MEFYVEMKGKIIIEADSKEDALKRFLEVFDVSNTTFLYEGADIRANEIK